MPQTDPRLLRLHEDDNVLTVISPLMVGEALEVGGELVVMAKGLPIGHKVAARAMRAGEKVIKYGVPIGSASRAIARGEHVHTQNLQSDYLPTYLREDQSRLFAAPSHP
jgi:hypothetical protein